MNRILLGMVGLLLAVNLHAQSAGDKTEKQEPWKSIFRESPTIHHALVHTKLEAKLNFDRAQLDGIVTLTLKPHFYPSNVVDIDAKGMDIHSVELLLSGKSAPLTYKYDGQVVRIQLNKTYMGGEVYSIRIKYTAKPNDYKAQGSSAITDAKGLYFINPDGSNPKKPIQVWTQGETEATSVWCPTIDRPNQKTTQEIILTIPDKYVSLSNGLLSSSKKNNDGTRTDTWKMNQPHAPYLFFLGVGDYAIVKDSYKGKEVSYYVEKEYEAVARRIFGMTPAMMDFFSKKLKVDYPWDKYAQMTARDYVSGAMENTTATLHQESAQQNARELVDGNRWESTIAHELFHHWFGDYVTTESWSNLTINESFANYSEYLWYEHRYGADKADEHNFEDMFGYLMSQSEQKDLVRYYYRDKEDMFDAVSYNKGGRILHMLRHQVGDDAFFKSLEIFLKERSLKTAEAHHLRLAFEEVTGKDLNRFFNQWYFGSGHPKLDISYQFDNEAKKAMVIVQQKQEKKLFYLPIDVDVYEKGKAIRYQVELNGPIDTLYFSYQVQPDHINVDASKVLLCEKTDQKGDAAFLAQFKLAKNYMDRKEALEYFADNLTAPMAKEVFTLALKDKFDGIRKLALELMAEKKMAEKSDGTMLANLAEKDPAALVRAEALSIIGGFKDKQYEPLFKKLLNDSSYSVAGAALEGLQFVNLEAAKTEAKKQSADAKGKLAAVISDIFIKYGTPEDAAFVINAYGSMPATQQKFDLTQKFCDFLVQLENTAQVKEGVDHVAAFRDLLPESLDFVKNLMSGYIRSIGTKKAKMKNGSNDAAIQEQINYINKIADKK